MTTQIERIYQAALLADAAYVTYDEPGYLDSVDWNDPIAQNRLQITALNGTSSAEDVPFGDVDDGRGWGQSQFQSFADRYEIVYHQPDQSNGFSATLFYDTQEQKYVAAFRGTNTAYPDFLPSDLLLALGLSSLSDQEQYSSISTFFQNAGLVDINGVPKPEFSGKVDFVGHSLGGYLSLWAMYEFRDLFAEVFTFNGAGISTIPGTPDYEYINGLVQDNPLSAAQLGRIHNFFAEEGPELVANDLTFFRPGDRQGVFVERDDFPGTVGFHSVDLLVESLAVSSLFSLVDPNADPGDIKNVLYAMSNESVGSLDRAVQALSDLLGEAYPFSTVGDIEDFRQSIVAALGELDSFGSSIELLLDKDANALAATASEDSDAGRGYRYALSRLLPFAVTAGGQAFASAAPAFDREHFSDSFLSDRALFLSTLLRMSSEDLPHGDLNFHGHFSDLEHGLAFNSDGISYGDSDISDLRARLAFGSESDDINTVLASSQDDRLYGMGGDDSLNGLGGSDYIEGGAGDDQLTGGDGGDRLSGGAGADILSGGTDNDYLLGGGGADTYIWNEGDGDDVIGDYDDAGDRIVINGTDLATLQFDQVAAGSPYYVDSAHPGLSLHYSGAMLTINVGSAIGGGSITVSEYSPLTAADYGIVLNEPVIAPPLTDLAVVRLGPGDDEVDASAYWRQQSSQGGHDWSGIAISFDAAAVENYSAGSLHGTLSGAFEGGPVNDHLTGDGGSNALHGLAGSDYMDGAAGDDFLEGGAGSDTLAGGAGQDLLFGSARASLADVLDPGSLRDQFYLSQVSDGPGDTNILAGGAGDDYVSGGEYTDYIDGGTGFNYLLGGAGADHISGGPDREIIYGDSALNYSYVELSPGVASEQLEIAFADGADLTGQYDDVIHAGAGHDTVWGELGDDEIHGDDGDDNLIGDRYHDSAYFSAELPAYDDGSPALSGALHGNDRLYGGAGNDLLLGLGGNDLLAGGTGTDDLLGGAGDDSYAFSAGDGLDRIDDVEGSHTLLFSGIALNDLKVLFQGDQVLVGTGYGAEGFHLSRSEWVNVRIALDTDDAVIERSRLDTLYFDAGGNLLLSINGSSELAEADRDALFTVDASDPDRPRIVMGQGVDQVQIEALAQGGATMRVMGGGIGQLVVELTAMQMATGLDFLQIVDGATLSLIGFAGDVVGSTGDDHIIGSGGPDTLSGGSGNDLIEGRGGNDELDGGTGGDVLRGGDGDDVLYGGQFTDRDYLDGGRGSDTLDGGFGPDTYLFAPGDGQDQLTDPEGYSYFEFGSGVNPGSVVFYYTGTTDSRFRFEYGQNDAAIASGGFSSYWINGVAVGGVGIPLVQRSDLADGVFRDTRWSDVFEPGGGSDTIHVSGWGNDAFRFAAGNGQDSIMVDNGFYPQLMGEIRLAADIDLAALSFGFTNGSATIDYGSGDQVRLVPDTVYSFRDNAFTRFTLVSEADPGWIPLIRAQGYGSNVYGSFGADHIVGNAGIETIIPSYGNDIIEADDGFDRIVLNGVYLGGGMGIGNKEIWGQGGNDTIETPLHQGLTFHYDAGDGHDVIAYDWSYSQSHPYVFGADPAQNIVLFQPAGQDTLAFGAGISLADLRFVRTGDTLTISLLDGSGSIRVDAFFPAYDEAETAWAGDVSNLFNPDSGPLPDSLLHPALLAALPKTPIAALQFADGTRYDMAAVLASVLEVSEATLLGSEGDDELYGTEGDDIIHALGGNDYIEDFGGSNVILAGEGSDQILVGSDSVIDPGPGTDWVHMAAGNHVIRFGPGAGFDVCILNVPLATAVVELAAGVVLDDIDISLAETEWGLVPLLTLVGTGDALLLASLRYDPEFDEWEADPDSAAAALHFADGAIITGSELYTLAANDEGESIDGTGDSDVLIGTEGNDIFTGGRGNDFMDGAGGDDLFVVEGRRQGKDRIIGGAGYDTISGGSGDDRISLTELLVSDGVEIIDGGPGVNTVAGSGRANVLDFSATQLLHIAAIEGRGGRDVITGSSGDDVIIGGAGRDTLSGGAGNDTYVFAPGDGRDVINNADADPASVDSLRLDEIDYDQVWLSRRRDHLVMNIAGSTDRVLIRDWYADEGDQLDAIYAGGHVLMRDQVDQLVSAMAVFDVPEGVGVIIQEQARMELQPVLGSVWQLAG